MRIGLVTGTFLPKVGGVEWKVHYLATEYTKHGHDVTVFCQKMRRPFDGALPVIPVYNVIKVGPPPIRGLGRLGIVTWLFKRKIMQQHHIKPFDVLHCHSVDVPTRIGVRVKENTGVPVVATTCGDDILTVPELGYGRRLIPHFEAMVRNNMRCVDVVGSISNAVKRQLEKIGTKANIADIPNGVDWGSFQKGSNQYFKDKLGLQEDSKIVVSVGRHQAPKDYPTGILAFSKVAAKHPKVHYVLVGRGTENLQTTVDQLKLNGRIHLVENVPMKVVPDVLHSSDIFFSPSMSEGFPQVVVQAMACGLPCVLTDCSGNEDFEKTPGVVLTRKNNASSMASGLDRVLSDPENLIKMSQGAHLDSKKYSWERIAEQYLCIFESIKN